MTKLASLEDSVVYYIDLLYSFLNQVHTGHRPVCTWFLTIDPVQIVSMCVCVCVCPPPRLLITSGMMWHDIDPIRLVKQVL